MAVRSKDEIMEVIKARIGTDTSDEALEVIEDITDTLDDYEARIAGAGDWKAKYEENDAAWRQRYKDRFFGSGSDDIKDDPEVEEPAEPEGPTTFEELFKEED